MFRTGAQMSLLVLMAGYLLFWLSRSGPAHDFDEAAGSRLAQFQGWIKQVAVEKKWSTATPPASVVLVAIDDPSTTNHPWPWTPLNYSLFVQAALGFQPEVLATDEVLDWDYANLEPADRQKLPQYEKILRDSLLRAPKVLLGAELGWPEDPNTIPPVREAPLLRRLQGDLRGVPEWTVIEHEPKEEFRLAATIGFTNLPGRSHAIHSVPLLLRYQGRVVPALPLQALLLWLKLLPDDVSGELGSHLQVGPKFRIPIDERGEMRVNFGAPYTVLSFDDLLLASEQTEAKQKVRVPVDRLAHAVALLGRTDRAADRLALGRGSPGTTGELFAAAIATMQTQAWLTRASSGVEVFVIAFACLLAGWVPKWRKKKVVRWTLFLLFLYGLVASALFASQNLLLPFVVPVGLALFIVLYRLATPNNVWKIRRPVIL